MSAILPNPFYYLDNFQRVLDWVMQRYDDLLSVEERALTAAFIELPRASRALLTRMVMRKGPFFRIARLQYDEIGCPEQAALPLIAAGWLDSNPSMTLDDVFGLLTKPDLTAVFMPHVSSKKWRKQALLDTLRGSFPQALPRSAWPAFADETICRVAVTDWCERLRLMFFGNLRQSWAEFVLSDLGIYHYEQVDLPLSARGFGLRRDVDDYLHLHYCRERYDQGENLDEIVSAIPVAPYANPWLESRRGKLLFRLAQQYERHAVLEQALALYRCCGYPGARLKQIRLMARYDDHEGAYNLAKRALAMPENEAEQQALLRVVARLGKKLGYKSGFESGQLQGPAPMRSSPEYIRLQLPKPDGLVSVEQAVCAHYSCDKAPVRYVENTLVNALFGLLCWPAIFAPLPGAFFHPFHHGPADLQNADFSRRRADLFDACLSQLDGLQYRDTILATYKAKFGIRSPFIAWGSIDEALLTLALTCLPAVHLKKWFERLLLDVMSNRSGFPDLIQFWPDEQRYRMVEVKGPGDRLQDNQIRWLEYCAAHGMPVAVCYVEWAGAAA